MEDWRIAFEELFASMIDAMKALHGNDAYNKAYNRLCEELKTKTPPGEDEIAYTFEHAAEAKNRFCETGLYSITDRETGKEYTFDKASAFKVDEAVRQMQAFVRDYVDTETGEVREGI